MADPKEQAAIRRVMAAVRSPCIVELGAHTGEDEDWLRASCNVYEAIHYVMVEPDPRNVQHLLERPTDRTRRVIIGAVSDKTGSALFHYSENRRDNNHASGSLRWPTGHLRYFPWVKFGQAGPVATYTLDHIFEREWLTKIDLLWVDIQGAERDMIAGGQQALKHTRYLFMETEREELYAGQALRGELLDMLTGWVVVEEFDYNILLVNPDFAERGPRVPGE